MAWLPEIALPPDQPPEAVQDVASAEDQVSVDDPPLVTDVGFAENDTVGGGGDTVTVADALCAPPNPVQVRLKVPLLVSTPEVSLPEVAFAPDQPPEAVQDVAFVEDQISVDDPPLVTDVGFAASDTLGTGGIGVPPPLVPPSWLVWSGAAGQPASAKASNRVKSSVFMRDIGKPNNGSVQRYLKT
jgi:hypothetical protein